MEIREIKQRLTILAVLQHYGLKTNKHDMLCCPFHEDKTPSLKIYPKTNTFHCFGCGANGDVIEFIQLKENCSKHQAIRKAESLINPTCNINPKPMEQKEEKNLLPRIAILSKIARDSQVSFKRTAKARDYIKSRKLDPDKTQAGYIGTDFGKGWNNQLQESALELGILKESRQNTITPKFKNCVLFFTRNQQGQIIDLYGRSITDSKESLSAKALAKAGKHFYLNGHHQGIYPKYPEPQTKKLILTEAIIDCATLEQQEEITKHFCLIALFGTNGFTQEIRETIKGLAELEEVILFFDGDQAGGKAILKHSQTLLELKPSLTITQVKTPDGEDINSLIQGHDAGIFTHLLQSRIPVVIKENEILFLTEPSRQPKQTTLKSEKKLDTSNPYRLRYVSDTAVYTVKGGLKKEPDSLRVSLDIEHAQNNRKSRCKPDLYEDRQVEKLCREAGEKLGLRPDLLETDLGRLTDLLDDYRENTLFKEQAEESQVKEKPLTPGAVQWCSDFLKKPDLLKRINTLIGDTGLTGEENNRLFLFIIASSYRMPYTLHALIQGSSGSGKTRLLSKTASFMPSEHTIRFTRVTENSFYNYDEYFFKNKLVCFEDLDGLKEEAQFAVRELISNQVLTSSTSVKDENGNISACRRTVRGPIASLSATTRGEIYEDNISRLFVIAVDESPRQTESIIRYQQQKACGAVDGQKERQSMEQLQNLVRMLRPLEVVNPYSSKIELPRRAHKLRRLNELFLSFIAQVTLIHQHQRRRDREGRLITTPEDIALAGEIMFESIFLKVDELDGSLRYFFESLKAYIQQKENPQHYEFTQREIRHSLHVSKTQLHRYINDLAELEYIRQSGGYANRGFTYKVVFWDNVRALREQIKSDLQKQLDAIAKI